MCIPMFSTFTWGRGGGVEAAGDGPATEADGAGTGAELGAATAATPEEAAGTGGAVAEEAATGGSGCGIGVDGARSQAPGRAKSARLRRRARVRIDASLLQENVG
jgi:hypothetical protein